MPLETFSDIFDEQKEKNTEVLYISCFTSKFRKNT